MYKSFLFIVFFLTFSTIRAQRDQPDNIDGIIVHPVVHGTVVFEWNNQVIYVDPYGGAEKFKGLAAPDIILITDIHGDHLNTKTLEALNTDKATFVVPQAVADQLPEISRANLVIIANGEEKKVLGIPIKAIPMYNLPESPDARHTKGRGNGYIINLGGKHIYLSGDTEDIPEMRSLKGIDIAFVCMNLPYTMDIYQAASAVLDFKPKIMYPYHYRGRPEISDTKTFKKLVNDKNPDIEVRLRNWYVE
ncbi:MBL fold metallo-hydrolase [Leptobacterium sp. I13]|uniref:MBL fold metallo-hydrolase n=1 Tax=Leptobacterium meishanense TaxID=3128904 RepID=UPI0030EE4CF6